MKQLFFKLTFLISLLIVILLGVDAAYLKAYKLNYQLPENVLPNPSILDKYQIVKLGNSHAQDGITFKGYKLKSLNLAGVAQKFEFDLALLKQYSNQIDQNAVIIINASPISFSHNTEDSQNGFQAIYYRRVSPLFIPHLNVSDYIESEFLPFTRVGYFWRQKHTEAITKRIAKEEKWVEPSVTESPPTETSSTEQVVKANQPMVSNKKALQTLNLSAADYFFNVEAIQKELAAPSTTFASNYMDNMDFIFNKWYHTDEFNPKFFETNRRDLENLIKYSLQHRWRPVVITIPISDHLQDGLFDDYMQVYLYDNLQKTDLHGTEYIDFSHDTRITKNTTLYNNADHLGPKGADIFSYELLQTLISKGYLQKKDDGYDYRPLLQAN